MSTMRVFQTGATRGSETGKLQYEGYLSPLVLQRYGQYMLKHATQADGQMRSSDNWQRGIPREAYIDSLLRHVMALWLDHDGYGVLADETREDALCGIMFNAMGYLFEDLHRSLVIPPPGEKL